MITHTMHGTGKQKCTLCDHQSVPGLVLGAGKCPFHWLAGGISIEWASECYPAHPAAIAAATGKAAP